MQTEPQPCQPDPAILLGQDIYYCLADTLRTGLPEPADTTPEGRDRQIRTAIADAAALVPASSVEARFAANAIAALAQAEACRRDIGLHAHDPKRAGQARAQAASMGRESRGYVNTLLRLQRTREKREATSAGCDSAAMTEHSVRGLLLDGLQRLPPEPPRPEAPAPAADAAPDAASANAATPGQTASAAQPRKFQPRDYSEWSDEEKARDRLRWEGDQYAVLYTERVKLMRKLGGLPLGCDFEAPRPELLEQILHGTSSNLRWADTYEPPPRRDAGAASASGAAE
jgi:hypothetical protein